VIAAAVLGLLILESIGPTSGATASVSKTPQVHFKGRSLALKVVLLTESDLSGLADAPVGLKVGAVNKTAGLYQDPDPRLPCGQKPGRAASMSAGQAVGEEISLPDGEGFEGASNVPVAKAKEAFALYEKDIHIGCSYQSTTNTGSTQSVTVLARIPMPQLVDQSLGLIETISSSGEEFGAYELLMRNGPTVAAVIIFTGSPLNPEFVLGLARRAEMRLTGQRST